ncbi:MAG: PilZ domain-containing protein [Desulfamplus sp.]|nr:PilZ domain-containing protein [Desulfamplus sp.]
MLNLFDIFKNKKIDFFKNKKRTSERISVKVMFKYSYDNKDYMGQLKNISVDGFGFLSSNPLESGKDIDMEVVVQCKECNEEKWVSLKEKAKIHWVSINRSNRLADYDVGCKFIEPDNEIRTKLSRMLEQILETTEK